MTTLITPNDTKGTTLIVRPVTEAERPRWDAFVEANTAATLYHLSCWGEIIRNALGHETILTGAFRGETLTGILPLTICRTVFGTAVISMPFLNYGGIVTDDPAARTLLYDAAISQASSRNSTQLELRNTAPSETGYAVRLEKATYILQLDDEEKTFAAFRKATRNRLRKMLEYNLTITRGVDCLGLFYDGFVVAMKEHGTPVLPKKFFAEVLRVFGPQARLYVASDGSSVAGCKCTISWRGTMYQIWGGYPHRHRHQLANYLLSWEATRDAIRDGLTACDFGRSSKDSGPAEFKRHFNCTEQQLYWEYPLAKTDTAERTVSAKDSKMQLAISLWKKLPLPLTRLLGPPLSRHLP